MRVDWQSPLDDLDPDYSAGFRLLEVKDACLQGRVVPKLNIRIAPVRSKRVELLAPD